jgi:hypothetical protein
MKWVKIFIFGLLIYVTLTTETNDCVRDFFQFFWKLIVAITDPMNEMNSHIWNSQNSIITVNIIPSVQNKR